MISQCPHCSRPLKFSKAHQEKLNQALGRMPAEKTLKLGCPKCKTPIELDKTGNAVSKKKETLPVKTQEAASIEPPKAPDISWLSDKEREETQSADDIPAAMVLIRDESLRDNVSSCLEELKFQIHDFSNIDQAIDSMRFKEYAVVVYSSQYEDVPLADQDFYKYMSMMSMTKRRSIFYALIGPEFNTLYDLEALTFSADLVINTRESDFLSRLFKNGLTHHEDLFGPYIDCLKKHGKN